MLKKIIYIFITVSLLNTAFAQEKDYILDSFNSTKTWKLILGREFKGAKGALKASSDGKMELSYDFTNGGKYIAIYPKLKLPENTTAFLKLTPEQDCIINYRIVDATGRYFQGRKQLIKKQQETKYILKPSGPWTAAWGGEKSKQPVSPYKNIFLMIIANGKLAKKGTIELKAFGVSSDKELKPQFQGENGVLRGSGWDVAADWMPLLSGALLKVTVNKTGDSKAGLSINFPEMGRDKVYRKNLVKEETFYYSPPIKNGGNLNNIYKLIMKITDQEGNACQTVLKLVGNRSGSINFGAPVFSKDIKSRFGVCTHFSYGKLPHWAPWAPYKKFIDGIAECGYKWIRDGASIVKQKDGSYKVHQYDLNWMKYAKSKGLNIIFCIRLYPDKSIGEYKKYFEAAVRDTRGLVDVFELGNEPHNFGWKKKFGGHWNGWDPKNKKTEKWVKEHLKYTNALADYLKNIYPDITVIGLGSTACTNLLALKEGASKNLDGIAEHPYTYSMPPEKIPFGKSHEKRDGVKVTDNGTFAELIKTFADFKDKNGKKRSLWLTEFGFTTFWFNGKNEKELYAGFTEKTQAVYLVRRFVQGLAFPSIAVACQYDYLDDYKSKEYNPEANFGIIRADHSRKPAYYAIQRMNSLFNGYKPDKTVHVNIEKQPLHRSCKRGVLIKSWDNAAMKASNEVLAYAFANPEIKDEKMIAVWSALPYSREFNNRVCTIKLKGLNNYKSQPVAIDIITGRSYDIMVEHKGSDTIVKNLSLKGNPIVIKFIK